MARKGVAVVVAALVTLSGCAQRAEPDAQRFLDHARDVAAAWSTADQQERWESSLIPLGPLTVEPDWSGHESLMAGVHAGALEWVSEKVGDDAASGTVRYADGSTESVTTLGARATLSELFHGGEATCPTTCTSAVVNAADLTTVRLLTARGPASVPAWAFHLEGLAEPVLRVAVAGLDARGDIEPRVPGTDRARGLQGLVGATVLLGEQGSTLTVRLPMTACSPAPRAEVLETATVVVVGATQPEPRRGDACAAVVRDQDVTVTLERPLGQRVLVTTGGRLVLPAAQPS
ncbi:hypothetical protein GCM10009867_36820 [Pedococcus aerophilus]|uniref:Lipoprotein n=1 Tax=Pedococcus aerophilus TaxID=436356 RepID=A0ABN3UWP5_9MICO